MKFDQDLCLNLQSDFGKMNSTLGSVVPLAMFETLQELQNLSRPIVSGRFLKQGRKMPSYLIWAWLLTTQDGAPPRNVISGASNLRHLWTPSEKSNVRPKNFLPGPSLQSEPSRIQCQKYMASRNCASKWKIYDETVKRNFKSDEILLFF